MIFGEWRDQAACKDHPNPDLWFPLPTDRKTRIEAVAICQTCPVAEQCRDFAIDKQIGYGIWGTLTEPERTKITGLRPSQTPIVQLPIQPCGTAAAYRRHTRNQEPPCYRCREAERIRRQTRQRGTEPCGTVQAYRRHSRKGETPCHACRQAWANDHRIKRANRS